MFVLACALLPSAGARAAVTYYFDWYCSGCAKLGKGSNGREGPFGSGSACEGARASLGGSLATRGCGSRCFNPQPCISAGQDVIPSPPAASAPAKAAPAYARAHVHIQRDRSTAKVWLQPVALASSHGFAAHELNEIHGIVRDNVARYLEKWNEHLGKTK